MTIKRLGKIKNNLDNVARKWCEKMFYEWSINSKYKTIKQQIWLFRSIDNQTGEIKAGYVDKFISAIKNEVFPEANIGLLTSIVNDDFNIQSLQKNQARLLNLGQTMFNYDGTANILQDGEIIEYDCAKNVHIKSISALQRFTLIFWQLQDLTPSEVAIVCSKYIDYLHHELIKSLEKIIANQMTVLICGYAKIHDLIQKYLLTQKYANVMVYHHKNDINNELIYHNNYPLVIVDKSHGKERDQFIIKKADHFVILFDGYDLDTKECLKLVESDNKQGQIITIDNLIPDNKDTLCAALSTNNMPKNYANFKDKTGKEWDSVISAYREFKLPDNTPEQQEKNLAIMTRILVARFQYNPDLITQIKQRGGVTWLEECCYHRDFSDANYELFKIWQGYGKNSRYIQALINAFLQVS